MIIKYYDNPVSVKLNTCENVRTQRMTYTTDETLNSSGLKSSAVDCLSFLCS